jgi:hypothetical protein
MLFVFITALICDNKTTTTTTTTNNDNNNAIIIIISMNISLFHIVFLCVFLLMLSL